jgi:hypothetical protein
VRGLPKKNLVGLWNAGRRKVGGGREARDRMREKGERYATMYKKGRRVGEGTSKGDPRERRREEG